MNTKDYVIYKLNNGHVLFDEESGYWFYAKSSNTTKQSTDKLNVPSDDEAIKIAEKFISTNKLFDGEIGNPVVSNVTTGGWGTPEQITAKTVYFYPSIEKYSVYGIYRIAITIGASGEISAIYKQANSVEKVSNVKLISKDTIQSKLDKKEYSASNSESLSGVKVNKLALEYYADGVSVDGSTYVYPVYVLSGEGKTAAGETQTFDVIMDAIA